MKHFRLLNVWIMLFFTVVNMHAVENKSIQIPLREWSANKLTAYRLEIPDNLLGERGETDERVGKSFTISTWVNMSSFEKDKSVIMGHGAKEHFVHNGSFVLNAISDGSLILLANNINTTLTAKVEKNVWTFLSIVYDNEAQTLTVYKDGEPAHNVITLEKQLILFGDNPCIFYTGGTLFSGACDEFQFFNKALTGDNVRKAMSDPKTVEGITALYDMNEEESTGVFANKIEGDKTNIKAVFNKVTGSTQWVGGDYPYAQNTPFTPTFVEGRTFAVKFEQPTTGGTLEIQKEGVAITSGDQFIPGTTLTVIASPVAPFITKVIYIDGKAIEGNTFTVDGPTTVSVLFDLDYCEPNLAWTGAFDRRITGVAITGMTQEAPTLTAPGANNRHTYFSKTAEVINASQGDDLSVILTHNSIAWMHFYVYVDYNHDGVFNETDELVSYSYHSSTGTDSKGVSHDEGYVPKGPNGEANMSLLPSFIIPKTSLLGKTRIRIKYDWNSKNPCGNPGEDATGKNTIDKTCGMIMDYTIDIAEKAPEKYAITFEQPLTGGTFEVQKEGVALTSGDLIEENTVLTVNATSNIGFRVKAITVNNEAIEENTFIVSEASIVAVEFEDNREYCTPTYSKGREVGHITSATTTGAIVNLNYKDTPSAEYYNKVVDESMVVKKGQTIDLTVNAINGRWGVERIFVDLDGDGVFTPDEMVIKYGDTSDGNNNLDNVTTSFIVPENIPLGKTRMRILFTDGDTQGEDNPCGSYTDGGFYDFIINVADASYSVTYANTTPDLGTITIKTGEQIIESGNEVIAGTELTIELAPNNENTLIASFTINDENKKGELKDNKMTIIATENMNIAVTFKSSLHTFSLVNTTPEYGTVTAYDYDTNVDVTEGGKLTEGSYIIITLTPAAGEKIGSLKYNNTPVDLDSELDNMGSYSEYTVEIKEDAAVEVAFTKNGEVGLKESAKEATAYYDFNTQTLSIKDNATAVVYNLVGNIIMTTNTKITDLSVLNQGCYLIKVKSATNQIENIKILKK